MRGAVAICVGGAGGGGGAAAAAGTGGTSAGAGARGGVVGARLVCTTLCATGAAAVETRFVVTLCVTVLVVFAGGVALLSIVVDDVSVLAGAD